MIKGKILITGATGLVGQSLVNYLLKEYRDIEILAVIRDEKKATKLFGRQNEKLKYIISDVRDIDTTKNYNIDYIVHAASQTDSKSFVKDPVETIEIAYKGTKNLLDLARKNQVKSFVYLSSMEVYGTPKNDDKIYEDSGTNLNTMEVRSCYPESKRICESLCKSYSEEYGVPAKVIRLTQTFGQGVQYDDNRVFAEFARCVIENRNIILKTKGETKRSYLHIDDAINAILCVLENGKSGEAYNAANEESYCSIYEMAQMLCEWYKQKNLHVMINETSNILKYGYAETLHINLDTSKLQNLGWKPTKSLREMYNDLILSMRDSQHK